MRMGGDRLCDSAHCGNGKTATLEKNVWVHQTFSRFGELDFAMMVTLLRNKACFLHELPVQGSVGV